MTEPFMTEPFTQADHDEAVEDGTRGILLGVGIVIGVAIILIFG